MAGKWLEAIPSTQKLTLSNAQFRTAAFMRLEVSLPQLNNTKKCVSQCDKDVDDNGYHLLTCRFGGGPIRRHDHFMDSFYEMLRSVDLRCRKELTAQFQGKQRPDIADYNYRDGKKLLLDITITHVWFATNLSGSSEKAGFAASSKERGEKNKYLQKASSLGHLFRPIAVEVFGRWFSNYLQGRYQRVSSFQRSSYWFKCCRGVPQVSVLGPILFSLYINDLPEVVKGTRLNLFADDTCLYVSAPSVYQAVEIMNNDLGHIAQWFKKNLLEINLDKSKSMIISSPYHKSGHEMYSKLDVKVDSYPIQSVTHHKYLGVTIDNHVTWSSHI